MRAADGVVRAITEDGCFRVIAARTTETVRAIAEVQRATPEAARALAELVTGAILVREAMAPQLRAQAILKNAAGTGSLVADCFPDGTNRGLVSRGGRGKGGAPPLLQVMRTLPNGAIHQGLVEVPPTGGVAGALMAYLQDSEQVFSTVDVLATSEGGEIAACAGYLVQLLPEVARGPLAVMTARLEDSEPVKQALRDATLGAAGLLGELLFGMPYGVTGESPLSFACRCSESRVLASLATLPAADLREMLEDGRPLEIQCDYCTKQYAIPAETLRSAVGRN